MILRAAAPGRLTTPAGERLRGRLDAAAHALYGESIGRLNDRRETTHRMILRCFDAAIAALEGHGPPRGRV